MNKIILVLASILFFVGGVNGQALTTPTWAWGKDFNNNSGNPPLICYKDGYVYIAGDYNSTLQIDTYTFPNSGGKDIYFAKLDTAGNIIWVNTISQFGNQHIAGIQVKNNEVILAGSYDSTSLQVGTTVINSVGSSDLFIAKYDTSGNNTALYNYGTVGNDNIKSFSIDYNNNIYIAGDSLYKFSNSGIKLWNKAYPVNHIYYSAIDSTIVMDGYGASYSYYSGGTNLTYYYDDIVVRKLTLNGDSVWQSGATINNSAYNSPNNPYNYVAGFNETDGNYFYSYTDHWNISLTNNTILNQILPNGTSTLLYAKGNILGDPINITNISANKNFVMFSVQDGDSYSYTNEWGTHLYNYSNNTLYKNYNYMPLISDSYKFIDTNMIFAHGSNGLIQHTFGKFGYDNLGATNTNQTLNICKNSTVNLIGNVYGGVPPLIYSWSPVSGLNNTNSNSVNFVADTNITYVLTVTDAINQSKKDTFNIIVSTPISPFVITSQYPTFCSDSMQLYSNLSSVNNLWMKYNVQSGYWSNYYPNPYTQNTTIYTPGIYSFTTSNICGFVSDTIEILPTVSMNVNSTDTTICLGDNVTLTASGASNYSWTNGVINGVSFTPSSTQTYTVTGSDANGCYANSSISIIVNPIPSITSISASNNNICTQGNSVLTVITPTNYCNPTVQSINSTDYISNFTFDNQINNSSTVSTSHYSNFNLTANVSVGQTYLFSITSNPYFTNSNYYKNIWIDWNQDGDFNDINENVFESSSITLTLNGTLTVPFNAINGKTKMRIANKWLNPNNPCLNDLFGEFEDYYIDITGGIDKVIWTPSTYLNTTIGNSVNILNINSTTTYTSTINNTYGCSIDTSISIYVNQTSNSNNFLSICSNQLPYSWNGQNLTAGGTYTYQSTNAAGCDSIATLNFTINSLPLVNIMPYTDTTICIGTSYVLFADSTYSSYTWTLNGNPVSQADSVVINNSGSYILTCVDSNSCSASDTVSITINPAPQPIIIQNNFVLNCTNVNATNYQWLLNNNTIGTNSDTLNITQNGSYVVIATDSTGCIGLDTMVVSALGLNNTNNSILIYPNPTNGEFTIDYTLDRNSNVNIKLLDVTGKVINEISKNENQQKGNYKNVINLKSLSITEGVYMLEFCDGISKWTQRILFKN